MSDAEIARGEGLLELKRPGEAETIFRQVLAADPANVDATVGLCQALISQGRLDEAVETGREALAVGPEDLRAHIVTVWALTARGDADQALFLARQGRALAPYLAVFPRQEGVLHLHAERFPDALRVLEEARSLEPNDDSTLTFLAEAHMGMRDFASAERLAREALTLNPNNADAHSLIGRLRLRDTGARSSVGAQREALRLDPTDPGYRYELAIAMKARNPLYRQLYRFHDWMETRSSRMRWAVTLSPLILSRVLRPSLDQWWAKVLLGVLILAVLLTWLLEPIMNLVLMASSYSRNLLPREAKRAASLCLLFLVAGIGAGVAATLPDGGALALVAFGSAIWALPAGSAHLVATERRDLVFRLLVVGVVFAALVAVLGAVGFAGVGVVGAVYLLGGLGMMWFVHLA